MDLNLVYVFISMYLYMKWKKIQRSKIAVNKSLQIIKKKFASIFVKGFHDSEIYNIFNEEFTV